jgi:hypothetical protein
MNRRGFLAGLMAGGVIVAGELWIPGQKLISIPSGKIYTGQMFTLEGQTIKYIGHPDKTVTINQFYEWLQKYSKGLMRATMEDRDTPQMVSLSPGYRMVNPEHLTHGTLAQDVDRPEWMQGGQHREIWQDFNGLGDADMVTDHVYSTEWMPRERITENDMGHKGLR